jgi:hypothetical protein
LRRRLVSGGRVIWATFRPVNMGNTSISTFSQIGSLCRLRPLRTSSIYVYIARPHASCHFGSSRRGDTAWRGVESARGDDLSPSRSAVPPNPEGERYDAIDGVELGGYKTWPGSPETAPLVENRP